MDDKCDRVRGPTGLLNLNQPSWYFYAIAMIWFAGALVMAIGGVVALAMGKLAVAASGLGAAAILIPFARVVLRMGRERRAVEEQQRRPDRTFK